MKCWGEIMERLTYRFSNNKAAIARRYRNWEETAAEKLACYEDTGLTPQEIEQMKARMPLHQWVDESPDKMSIFGVPVSRIIELTDAEKQGRLIVLSVEDIHPCRNCDTGWGSISSSGCTSCEETCERLKEYNEKYMKGNK